jgi:hypothetical protein
MSCEGYRDVIIRVARGDRGRLLAAASLSRKPVDQVLGAGAMRIWRMCSAPARALSLLWLPW